MSNDCQDWTVVTLRKKQPKVKGKIDPYTARQQGVVVDTITKKDPSHTLTKVQREALNNDGEPNRILKIDKSVAQKIQKARNDLNMTRKELAQKINEKETVLAEYEKGTAIPNTQILNKIEKVLKQKLR